LNAVSRRALEIERDRMVRGQEKKKKRKSSPPLTKTQLTWNEPP